MLDRRLPDDLHRPNRRPYDGNIHVRIGLAASVQLPGNSKASNGLYCRIQRIDAIGGVVAAIEEGFFQREIQDSSFRYQRAVEAGTTKVVGVNAYTIDTPVRVPRLKISEEARRSQSRRLRALRERRNPVRHAAALERLRRVAGTESGNTMPAVLDALKARATLGEIVHAFQDVFGSYRERATY